MEQHEHFVGATLHALDIVVVVLSYFCRMLYDVYMVKVALKKHMKEAMATGEPLTAAQKRGFKFDLKFYYKDNLFKWFFTFVAMWVLVLVIPEVLYMFDKEMCWNSLVAAGIGFSTLEIVQFLIKRGKRKLKKLS